MVRDCKRMYWKRKYYSVGTYRVEFSLDSTPASLLGNVRYIYNSADGYTGVINKTGFRLDEGGERVAVCEGTMPEGLLSYRVIDSEETVSGTAETIARSLVGRYALTGSRAITALRLGGVSGFTDTADFSAYGDRLSDKLYALLGGCSLSWRVRCDFTAGELIFEVWSGLNRSSAQSLNGRALFTEQFGNVSAFDHEKELTPYNFAYVKGSDGSASVDRSNGIDRRELFVSASKLRLGELTESQYNALLLGYGRERLDAVNMRPVITVTADQSAHPRFHDGFELGDLCDLEFPSALVSGIYRLTETYELYENESYTLELGFGS